MLSNPSENFAKDRRHSKASLTIFQRVAPSRGNRVTRTSSPKPLNLTGAWGPHPCNTQLDGYKTNHIKYKGKQSDIICVVHSRVGDAPTSLRRLHVTVRVRTCMLYIHQYETPGHARRRSLDAAYCYRKGKGRQTCSHAVVVPL